MKLETTATTVLFGYSDLLQQNLKYMTGFAQFCDSRPLNEDEAKEIEKVMAVYYGDYHRSLKAIATEIDGRMKKSLKLKKSPFEMRKTMENIAKKYPVLAQDWKAPEEEQKESDLTVVKEEQKNGQKKEPVTKK